LSEIARERATAPALARSIDWPLAARTAAAVVAASYVGYFLFTGMPQLTLQVFPRTLVVHVMVGAVAVAYLAYLAASRRLPGGTLLDLGVLAFVAAYAIAAATSVSWRVSIEATLQIAAALMIFYALADLPLLSADGLRRGVLLLGLALAVYALWVVGNDYADYLRLTRSVEGLDPGNIFPPTVPRVHDVSDHTNVLAMLLALFMPFFALAAWRPSGPWERAAGIAALACGAMALFLTLSRGGWAGAGAGLVLAAAGWWTTLRVAEREAAGSAWSWRSLVPAGLSPTALAAIGGAIALAVFGVLAFLSKSSARPGWLFRSSLSPREDAWKAAWHIFTDNPLTGAGPGTFGLLYPQYSGKFAVHTQHAHNGFLQVADDAGLLGLLGLAALAGASAWLLWRTWRDGALLRRLLAVTVAAGLLGFAVHNVVDAGNIWKAPGFALAIVGALLVRTYRESHATAPARALPGWAWAGGLAARTVLAALVVVPLLGWYRIDRAHHSYWLAMDAFPRRGDPAHPDALRTALRDMQDAVDRDSSMMVYQLQLGQMQATVYAEAQEKDRVLIDNAVAHLQRAVALDERSDIAHADLARAYQLAGDDTRAADEAAKVRVIARDHMQPVLAAGEVYEDLGRTDDAIATYAQALSIDAGLSTSTFWQETGFRRAHFDDVLARSAIAVNGCTHGSYLVEAHRFDPRTSLAALAQDAEACKFLVFSRPDDLVLRVAYARILMQQGERDDALGHLLTAEKRQPDFGPVHTELGRWYADAGDLDAARHEWVRGSELDQPESVLLLGDSYPAGQVPKQVRDRLQELVDDGGGTRIQNDLQSILYYRMKYGRVSPLDTMIPGGWQRAEPRIYAEMRSALDRWDEAEGG